MYPSKNHNRNHIRRKSNSTTTKWKACPINAAQYLEPIHKQQHITKNIFKFHKKFQTENLFELW